MYPLAWGSLFWNLIHSIAYRLWKDQPRLSTELQQLLSRFFLGLCLHLPCPGCSHHCTAHVSQHPPNFTTGEAVWTYTVDFHNEVNARSNVLQISYAEAEQALANSVALQGHPLDRLSEAFPLDWWFVVFLATKAFFDFKRNSSEQGRDTFRVFLTDLMRLFPFAQGNSEVTQTLEEAIKTLNLEDLVEALKGVTGLFNAVCFHFGVLPRTYDEMVQLLSKRFPLVTSSELLQAAQMRQEDHRKMAALQKELAEVRGASSAASGVGCTDGAFYAATIALAVVCGVLLLCLLVAVLVLRFGPWRITRVPGGFPMIHGIQA